MTDDQQRAEMPSYQQLLTLHKEMIDARYVYDYD